MSAIKNIFFVKKFDDIKYGNKILELEGAIVSVVDRDVLKKIDGFWPDFDALSSHTIDSSIKQNWPVDAVSNDFHSRAEKLLSVQSGDTLILFDPKMYESYPPSTDMLFKDIVKEGVRICSLDDLFR